MCDSTFLPYILWPSQSLFLTIPAQFFFPPWSLSPDLCQFLCRHVTFPTSLTGCNIFQYQSKIPSDVHAMNILNTYTSWITEQAPEVKQTREGRSISDSKHEVSWKIQKMKRNERLIFYSLPFSHIVANTTLRLTVENVPLWIWICWWQLNSTATRAWWRKAERNKERKG